MPPGQSSKFADRRRHFAFLDGMRGVAALAVGWLHAASEFHSPFAPYHAYLAVDFFFILSGFVIAYAYDQKFSSGMTLENFALVRMIRLYPMIFAGVALGCAVSAAIALATHSDLGPLIAPGIGSFLLLPLATLRGQQAYPVNNPIWSLFFELIANAVYGLYASRCTLRTASSGVALGVFAVSLTGLLLHYGSIQSVGTGGRLLFLMGLVRVAFPFTAGVLIYRYRLFQSPTKANDLVLMVALSCVLVLPVFPDSPIYDGVSIMVVLPLLVTLGAGDFTNPLMNSVWKFLGGLSYPFYIIHLPIIRAAAFLYSRNQPHFLGPGVAALCSVLAALVVASGVFLFYDRPVRRWLTTLTHSTVAARSRARS